MGEDSDVLPDGDNGYTTSFGGRWAAWNGEFIKCCAVDKTDNITIFTTPVMVNEEQGVIRFSYDIGKESFKVLGFLPSPNGNVVERLQSLNNGDQITLLYDNRTDSYEEILTEGASFEYDESQNIRLENFPDGYFQNYILITDIFGNTYKSNQLVCQWSKGKMSEIVITTDEDTENSEA